MIKIPKLQSGNLSHLKKRQKVHLLDCQRFICYESAVLLGLSSLLWHPSHFVDCSKFKQSSTISGSIKTVVPAGERNKN